MPVTIRETTEEEKKTVLVNGESLNYIVVDSISDFVWYVFGFPQGGNTKEEAVFWAERLASKNGLIYQTPEGWEDIVGKLPNEK